MKTCSSLLRTALTAAVMAVLPFSTLNAQQQKPQKASDAHVTELMNAALAQVGASQTAQGGVQQSQGPTVDLRLEDAVGRAMDQNIDLAVARLNPQLQDLSLSQLRAAYRPTLSSTIGDQSRNQTSNSTIAGASTGQVTNTQTYTYNGGLSQVLPWTGGTASLSWNNTRAFSDNNTITINPTYTSTFQARFQQSLWRNFRIDNNRNSLITGIISRQISDINLRASVVNTEASTRNAYWDLVFAV